MIINRTMGAMVKEILAGVASGLLLGVADALIDRTVHNRFNQRILRYDLSYIVVLPVFLMMRNGIRKDNSDPTMDTSPGSIRMDAATFAAAFFTAGMGRYLSYLLRGYLEN